MSTQTPREIAFEDIRAGDRIRARRVEYGVEFTREGVAHKNAGGWFTGEDGLIVSATSEATITLLHRPAPAEPRGIGAVVRARTRSGSEAGLWVRHDTHHVNTAWIGANPDNAPTWSLWGSFDPDSIEVLSEGIEVES